MEDRGFVAYPCYGGFYFDHLTLRRSTVPKTKKRYLSFSKRSIPPWIYCLFCFSSLFGTEPAYLVLIVVDTVDLHTTEDTEADAPAEEQADHEHGDLHFTFLPSLYFHPHRGTARRTAPRPLQILEAEQHWRIPYSAHRSL